MNIERIKRIGATVVTSAGIVYVGIGAKGLCDQPRLAPSCAFETVGQPGQQTSNPFVLIQPSSATSLATST